MAKSFEEKIGDCTARIVVTPEGFRGAVIRKGKATQPIDDTDHDRLLARLRNEAGTLHPNYYGMDGAIERFLSFFPGGFSDPLYLEDERSYKLRSQERLNELLPLEAALDATPEQAAEVRHAFVTNLLSPFELARASAVLRGATGLDYVRSAAAFSLGDFAAGLEGMTKAIAPQGRISWPLATYLPNLWDASEHMFLKPVATCDFAERIGHTFQYAYDPAMDAAVYTALLELVKDTEQGLAKLNPMDRIDVQSFIWVVGDYGEAESAELDARRAKICE